jgi:signal transduction histidine kinase
MVNDQGKQNKTRQMYGFYLENNVSQTRIGIILILVPAILLTINDIQFMGFSNIFFFVEGLKTILVLVSVFFILSLKKMSAQKYGSLIFVWSVLAIITFQLMISTRPVGFLFHLLTMTTFILVIWLVIPQSIERKTFLAVTATLSEIALTAFIENPISTLALFTISINFFFANVVGFLSSRQREVFRSRNYEFFQENNIKAKKLMIANEKLKIAANLNRHDVTNRITIARANLFLIKNKIHNPALASNFEAIEESFVQSDKLYRFIKEFERIDLEDVGCVNVWDCFDAATKLISYKGVEVMNGAEGLVVIANSMLKQLFFNLIENSLIHGKKVSKIELTYVQNNYEKKLIYTDNGIGLSLENKKNFSLNEFSSASSEFGFLFVKSIIKFYGWSIAEEGEEGKGSKFIITIPEKNCFCG